MASLNLVLYICKIVVFVCTADFFYNVVDALLEAHEVNELLLKFQHFGFKFWTVNLLFDKFGNEFKAELLLFFLGVFTVGQVPEFHFASEGFWEGRNCLKPSVSDQAFVFEGFKDGAHAAKLVRVNFL